MNANDLFRPLWLRVAIVLACAAWAVLEWLHGETGWALLAAAATAWGAWSLILAWRPDNGGSPKG